MLHHLLLFCRPRVDDRETPYLFPPEGLLSTGLYMVGAKARMQLAMCPRCCLSSPSNNSLQPLEHSPSQERHEDLFRKHTHMHTHMPTHSHISLTSSGSMICKSHKSFSPISQALKHLSLRKGMGACVSSRPNRWEEKQERRGEERKE